MTKTLNVRSNLFSNPPQLDLDSLDVHSVHDGDQYKWMVAQDDHGRRYWLELHVKVHESKPLSLKSIWE
jgi:hypothetical protein